MRAGDNWIHWREFGAICAEIREEVPFSMGVLMMMRANEFMVIGTWNVSDRRRPHHANTNTFPHHLP